MAWLIGKNKITDPMKNKFPYKTKDAFFIAKIDYSRKTDRARNISFNIDDFVGFKESDSKTVQELIEYTQNEHRKLLERRGESGFVLSSFDIKLKMEGCWDSVYAKVYTDCIKESDEDYKARIKKEEEKCEKQWQKYLAAKNKYEKELEKELKRLKN